MGSIHITSPLNGLRGYKTNCTLLSIVTIHYEASVWTFLSTCHPFLVPKIEFCDHFYVPQSECDILATFANFLRVSASFSEIWFWKKTLVLESSVSEKSLSFDFGKFGSKNLAFRKFGLGKSLGLEIFGLENK